MDHCRLSLVTLGLCLLVSGTLSAQEPNEARVHYDRATSAFALGRFADAAVEYEKAFELKPDPALLFNAAQAHRKAGNRARALMLYENYLRIFGQKVTNRAEVMRQIAELKKQIQVEGPGSAPEPPKETPPESPRPVAPGPPEVKPTVTAAPAAAVSAVPVEQPAPSKPLVKKGWFWGVVVGAAAVVGGAIALGVVLGSPQHDPTATLGTVQVNN